MTSKKNSEARNEQIASKSAQCDPNQLPSVSEKGFNTNLMNRKTSTEYKEKKSTGEVRNVENEEEEEDDLGNGYRCYIVGLNLILLKMHSLLCIS